MRAAPGFSKKNILRTSPFQEITRHPSRQHLTRNKHSCKLRIFSGHVFLCLTARMSDVTSHPSPDRCFDLMPGPMSPLSPAIHRLTSSSVQYDRHALRFFPARVPHIRRAQFFFGEKKMMCLIPFKTSPACLASSASRPLSCFYLMKRSAVFRGMSTRRCKRFVIGAPPGVLQQKPIMSVSMKPLIPLARLRMPVSSYKTHFHTPSGHDVSPGKHLPFSSFSVPAPLCVRGFHEVDNFPRNN